MARFPVEPGYVHMARGEARNIFAHERSRLLPELRSVAMCGCKLKREKHSIENKN